MRRLLALAMLTIPSMRNVCVDLGCRGLTRHPPGRSRAGKTMVERTEERFNIKPKRLAADTAYGSGPNLNWLVNDKDIAPHIPVIDKSKREDGTFSREDFRFDKERNVYVCPAGKTLNDDWNGDR